MTAPDAPRLSAPWGPHPFEPGGAGSIHLGPLKLAVRYRGDEIWLSHAAGDWTGTRKAAGDPPADRDRRPAEEEWVRWPVPGGTDGLDLSPVFPDRPLVLEPERPFRLLPRARARIFVSVPLWVRLTASGGGEQVLTDVPSVVLSDTWWGSTVEGELCYWLPTSARREVGDVELGPNVAICPLHLVNRSDDQLPVDKISLRVAHLSIFADDGRLWADETRVRYEGAEERSTIEVSGRAPPEAPEAARVAEPREPPPAQGFRGRTFQRLRALPGMGGL